MLSAEQRELAATAMDALCICDSGECRQTPGVRRLKSSTVSP